MITFGGVGPFDLFTMLLYAFGGTVVLGLFLVFCLITSRTPSGKPKDELTITMWVSQSQAMDCLFFFLTISNIDNREEAHYVENKHNMYPNLYRGFTKKQFDAAMLGLSGGDVRVKPELNPKIERIFDLDVAKLLYVH